MDDVQKTVRDVTLRSPLEKVASLFVSEIVKFPTKECAQGNGYNNLRQNINNRRAGRTRSLGLHFFEDCEKIFPGSLQGIMSGHVPLLMPFRSEKFVGLMRSSKLMDLNQWHSELWERTSPVITGLDSLLLLLVLGDAEMFELYNRRFYRELISFWVEDKHSRLTEILLDKLKTPQIQFADIRKQLYGENRGQTPKDQIKKLERDKRRFQRTYRRGRLLKLDLKSWRDYFVALLELRRKNGGGSHGEFEIDFDENVNIYMRLFFWSCAVDLLFEQFLQETCSIGLTREQIGDRYDRIQNWVETNCS